MVATLNFYLAADLSFSWREASVLAARAAGRAASFVCNIRHWLLAYLRIGRFPLHRYGRFHWSVLEDEDIRQIIQLRLMEKSKEGYIRSQDIVDIINEPEMQEKLGGRCTSIMQRTAQRWLKRLDWCYGRKHNGMYVDGHERPDVVKYRTEFIQRWNEYSKWMVTYDNDGNVAQLPKGFPIQGGRFRLILVTHDESTFYANDRRKTKWIHSSKKAVPEWKGEGASLMVSDFLTLEWGRLKDAEELLIGLTYSEAQIVFKAGKNQDGYFTADDLQKQVETAIDIFEIKTNHTATGLFVFDNAPSHQKRAPDALSARKMPKGPKADWTHHKDGPRMRYASFADGTPQCLYFPVEHPMLGWFKGMEVIIKERGQWPDNGLNVQCPGFKCEPDSRDCCCRRLLFMAPDFVAQKSYLEEYITSRGHICDFYPKFHCELNFIEQYWGAAKYHYCSTSKTNDIKTMEENMLACLDKVSHLQIISRYGNRSARFLSAYSQGLTGAEAAWANRKCHSHRTLPPSMVEEVKLSLRSE
ncbi:hypothetical protein K439DRAFT_1343453 [Ramaria rubella]|nr:hypothetical protein K439DRAFT_1343453 [Ramaria rubella]